MKNIVLALLAVILAGSCSCSRQPKPQTYDNPLIGLSMTYPGTWQVMKREVMGDAIASAQNVMPVSQETVDLAKELAPSIVLTLVKPRKVDGVAQNPSINIFAMPVPIMEWKDFDDMDTLIQAQIADVKASIPGSEVTPNVFPLSAYPAIHNYSSRITLADRTVTQYQYAYWSPPYFVQVVFSFSHPDDESEVKEIIQSLRIKEFDKTN